MPEVPRQREAGVAGALLSHANELTKRGHEGLGCTGKKRKYSTPLTKERRGNVIVQFAGNSGTSGRFLR